MDMYHNAKLVASLKASTRDDYADAGNAVILDLAVGDTVKVGQPVKLMILKWLSGLHSQRLAVTCNTRNTFRIG